MVGLGLVALLAGPALAQGQGRGFGMMGGGGLAMLIGNASVQKELKLDEKQVDKAKDYAASAREKFAEIREKLQGLEGEERRTKQQELTKEMNEAALKAFGDFLKPEQIARLKQVSLQVRGAQAFSDPEVAKKLNLTDSQKSDIQAIVTESGSQMREIFQSLQDDREAGMKKMAELRKKTLAEAQAKLNDEQQKTWKELIGSPFEYIPDPPRQQ
jgi:hypothetical protein